MQSHGKILIIFGALLLGLFVFISTQRFPVGLSGLPFGLFGPAVLKTFAQSISSVPNLPIFFFLKDLKLGDSDPDVLELQKMLNTDVATQVSIKGTGSPGNETIYFGPSTADGVKRFQNKYADEVLRPAGLTQGSGFVGLWTRLKLNQLLLKAKIGQTPSNTTINTDPFLGLSQSSLFSNSKELILSFPSAYSGKSGTPLTLSGSGFSAKSNTIFFKKDSKVYKVENVAAKSSKEITFTIPDVPTGRYDISVANGNKTGDTKNSGTLPFVVTVDGAEAPVVEAIEPRTAGFGKTIKITGRNFTSTGNIVTSNLGVVRDISSRDGQTLSFVLQPPGYLDDNGELPDHFWTESSVSLTWPVVVRVVNENGVSADSEAAKFEMKI